MNVCFAPCKGMQESLGYWIPRPWISDSRYWIPAFVSESWVLDSIVSGIPDSFSCISDSKAPENSEFRKHNFLGFRIQDSHPAGGEIVYV